METKRERAALSGLTRDVDGTLAAADIDVAELVDKLRAHGLIPRIEDAIAFARANQVLLLRHEGSGVDVDLSLAWLHADRVDLSRVRRILSEFAQAIEEPERPAEFERIVQRVLG